MLKLNYKKLGFLDIGLIKWSVMFFTLFIVSVWPAFTNFITNTHWAIFLVIALLLGIKPIMTVFKK
jgi:hypothetical protein